MLTITQVLRAEAMIIMGGEDIDSGTKQVEAINAKKIQSNGRLGCCHEAADRSYSCSSAASGNNDART